MNMDELVKSVDGELAKLESECVAVNENPRMIVLIQQLRRLTQVESDVAETQAELPQRQSTAAAVPGECPHTFLNIYGVCKQCGLCQHTQKRDGFCVTCGEPEKRPAESAPAVSPSV